MKEVRRCVSTGFWNDDKVLNDFSPEDKYFMLYLLTNPYTTQLGVYHLPLKKAALELGYSLEAVNTLLERFEGKYRIIKFNRATSEIAIKNYLKHSVLKGGKPVMDCLERDLKSVKDMSLVGYVFAHISDSVNETVHEFIDTHLDIKDKYIDNDNDIYIYNERIVNESYNESSKKPRTKKVSVEWETYYPEDELLDKAFKDYVAMRNKIKKPFTSDEAIEKTINKLDKLSNGDHDIAIQILDESVMNSWQGIFSLKEDKVTKKPRDIISEWRNA